MFLKSTKEVFLMFETFLTVTRVCPDCKDKNERLERVLKAVMKEVGARTLFVTWNDRLDEFTVFTGCSNLCDEFVCSHGDEDLC